MSQNNATEPPIIPDVGKRAQGREHIYYLIFDLILQTGYTRSDL